LIYYKADIIYRKKFFDKKTPLLGGDLGER